MTDQPVQIPEFVARELGALYLQLVAAREENARLGQLLASLNGSAKKEPDPETSAHAAERQPSPPKAR